jgi:hypothetical protein
MIIVFFSFIELHMCTKCYQLKPRIPTPKKQVFVFLELGQVVNQMCTMQEIIENVIVNLCIYY